jgi:hypothetical protein
MEHKDEQTREQCRQGWHEDPDNSGMCIHCSLILDPLDGEDPNWYRRSLGLPDVPDVPCFPSDEDD